MAQISNDTLWEALYYYMDNSFGYYGVRDYVECDFAMYRQEDRDKIEKFIIENM